MDEKKEWREKMISQRNGMKIEEKKQFDNQICSKLIAIIKANNPKVIHCFIPMGNEININPVIEFALKEKITVICPKAMKGRKMDNLILTSLLQLESGIYGTQHPSGNNIYNGAIDLIITPGLAFENNGNRLGYGAGYYDSFLAQNHNALSIGIAYEFQILENIPQEEHDVPVKVVVTNTMDSI